MDLNNVELLFDSNPNPMWVFDPETYEIVAVNKAAIDLYGYTRSEFLSMTIKDLRPQSETEHLVQEVQRDQEGLNKAGIWKHITKESKILYLRIHSHPFKKSGNKYKLVTAQDITDQQLLKNTYLRERELLNILVEKLPGTFFVFNKDGQMLRWNKQLEIKTGFTGEEIIKKPITSYFDNPEKEKIKRTLQEAFESGNVEIESEILKKDGEKIPILFNASTVTYQNEKCIVGIGIDISHLKKLIREKEVLLSEVHHRVKNNLAVISGILQLQKFDSNNEQLIKHLDESLLRIKVIADIHELLYQNENFANIYYDDHLRSLKELIEALYTGSIDLFLLKSKIALNVNQAVPLSLLLCELILPVFKEKDKKSSISLCLDQYSNGIELDLIYNGNAIQKDAELITLLGQQLEADFNWYQNGITKLSINLKKQNVRGSSSSFLQK